MTSYFPLTEKHQELCQRLIITKKLSCMVWKKTKDYHSVKEFVRDKFFDGKSINKILDEIDIVVS
jgi:hypothetical protein